MRCGVTTINLVVGVGGQRRDEVGGAERARERQLAGRSVKELLGGKIHERLIWSSWAQDL